jgi:hypothetical protein
VPNIGYFHLDSMLSQLRMFERLDFQPEAVRAARETVEAFQPEPAQRFHKIVVASGHMIDMPDRDEPRFPPEKEGAVRERMAAQLDAWRIGVGDLALSSAARGADILFAELCLERGASVHLHLALTGADFVRRSVRLPGSNWEERYFRLIDNCKVAYQPERLGEPPEGQSEFARNNRWIVNTAFAEADADASREAVRQLHALLVWDERPTGDGPGGASDFAATVQRLGGRLHVVNPTKVHP